jgi:hypothetical protein
MTPDEIRRQFDMRVAVPTGQVFVERYWERSEAARNRLKSVRDVRYGPGPRQMLDIFPAAQPNAPLAMFWHGGGWRYQSKAHFSYVAEPLVAAGVAAVLVGYDLHPEVTLPRMIEEACEAIAWTVRDCGTDERLRGIAFHRGHFITVGYRGTILTSRDGVAWTSRRSGTKDRLLDVTTGNGVLVAVGWHGVILTSLDGRHWSQRASGSINDLREVKFQDGRFEVFVGNEVHLISATGRRWMAVPSIDLAVTPLSASSGASIPGREH